MKYIYIYICGLLLLSSQAQNLVPNPSFETYTMCPSSLGEIEYALPWNAATNNSSTDYFNSCSSITSIPYNLVNCFQYPRTGNAYAGICFTGKDAFTSGIREYLQVQLVSSLIQNKTYYVEFYVNLNNNSQNWPPCNNIAANLSISRPFTSNFGELQPLTPHIMLSGNPVITDTLNWVKISGCYTAQGGEEYLTIGNFFDDTHTQISGSLSSTYCSYYYIDDVSVIETTSNCLAGVNEQQMDNYMYLSPNPSQGVAELHYQLFNHKDAECMITDISGRFISTYQMPFTQNKIRINEAELQSGIYFYSIRQGNVVLKQGKLVVYH